MLTINHVSVEYKHSHTNFFALKNMTLHIKQGEWLSISGPSGSGKTTLLNCISGLQKPTTGDVVFNNQDLYTLKTDDLQELRRKSIGYVFQDFRLLPQYNVFDNVCLPLVPYASMQGIKERAAKLLKDMGLAQRASYLPEDLSGGEKQRAAIVRALIGKPDILICDEPTGNLDVHNRNNILHIFKDLHEQGHTIIMATHDPEVADRGQRSIFIKNGEIDSVVIV